jgi:hypothetical protein
MDIIKKYHDKKWTLQFIADLYNSIHIDIDLRWITVVSTEQTMPLQLALPL